VTIADIVIALQTAMIVSHKMQCTVNVTYVGHFPGDSGLRRES